MGWRVGLGGGGEESRGVRGKTNAPYSGYTSSPRKGLTVVLTHSVPNTLERPILSEYDVPACSPMM